MMTRKSMRKTEELMKAMRREKKVREIRYMGLVNAAPRIVQVLSFVRHLRWFRIDYVC